MNLAGLLLSTAALITPGSNDCLRLEAAHAALLKSSFTCVRHFKLTLNGALKARKVTRLTYSNGELTRETLEQEVLDENLVLEEGDVEAALAVPFECDRLELLDDGPFELSNAGETETVVFVQDRTSGALRPTRWTNRETARFLWKKFVIEAVAEYKDFAWE